MLDMTSEEVAARVDSELASCKGLDGWHGIHLGSIGGLRLPPTRREFTDPVTGSTCRLWVVIDERAGSQTDGYLVVFDDASGYFGLATKGCSGHTATFIGFYGNLAETLNGM
jgi:hypothetical protein